MTRIEKAVERVQKSEENKLQSMKCLEIAAKYPGGIHVTGILEKEYNGAKYFVCTFAEEPNKYFSAGVVLTQKIKLLLEDYDGDYAELNNDLKEYSLELQLKRRQSKQYVYVDAVFGKAVKNVIVEGEDGIKYNEDTGEVIGNPF